MEKCETTRVTFQETFKLISRRIVVHCIDDTELEGYLYTVDPISATLVLVSICDKSCELGPPSAQFVNHDYDDADHKFKIDFVMDHALSNVKEIFSEHQEREWKIIKQYMDAKLSSRTTSLDLIKDEDASKMKEDVIALLKLHRIPVQLDGNSILVLNGAARIEPPYNADSCHSSNSIVLDKIRKILLDS
eukprot:gene20062-22031_t